MKREIKINLEDMIHICQQNSTRVFFFFFFLNCTDLCVDLFDVDPAADKSVKHLSSNIVVCCQISWPPYMFSLPFCVIHALQLM